MREHVRTNRTAQIADNEDRTEDGRLRDHVEGDGNEQSYADPKDFVGIDSPTLALASITCGTWKIFVMQSKSMKRTTKMLMMRPVQRAPLETVGTSVTVVLDTIGVVSSVREIQALMYARAEVRRFDPGISLPVNCAGCALFSSQKTPSGREP
jgi:hypothetical protein